MTRLITVPLFLLIGLIVGVGMFGLTIAMALEAGWRRT
jgi:hypothetical protein